MTPFILLAITLGFTEGSLPGTRCNDFQANFNLKDVVGAWHVVGIIPEKLFHGKQITCHKVEISETDEAGLRWLINKTIESPKTILPNNTTGIIIRQRYHSEHPFDVWSKSVSDINGCFQQVISLDLGNHDIHKALKHDAMMQLHLLEVKGSEPFLIQLLWGKMINIVIFRRKQAGLRWLINKTIESPKTILPNNTTGIIIRQRYHSEHPFDVWSKSVSDINGCFQQVISLDLGNHDIHKALKHDAMMQLHLLEVKGSEPFLIQLLWGKMINIVIFRRKQGVTQDELKPVFEFISNLRGTQRLPQICETPKDLLVF